MIDWFPLLIVKLCVTGVAALQFESPAWLAVIEHVPTATNDTTPELDPTVQTAVVVDVYATANPEEADAAHRHRPLIECLPRERAEGDRLRPLHDREGRARRPGKRRARDGCRRLERLRTERVDPEAGERGGSVPRRRPESTVAVPWSVPVPEAMVTVTLRLAARPMAESLPKASRAFTTGWMPNAAPAVAEPGCVVKASVVAVSA